MRLTVVGSSASYATAGHACSGYLVEGGGSKVMFDCGNGALANLTRVLDPLELDAIFITHAHPDHFADIFAMQSVLRYAPTGPAPALPLYLPPGLFSQLKSLLSGRGAEELDEAFVVHELSDKASVSIGGLVVTPVAVEHTQPTFALRAQADGGTIAYTADSASGPWLRDVLKDASLGIAEATLPDQYSGVAPHLTAREAGRYAREAGVVRLVLTHIWPTNDRATTAAEASDAFGATVTLAEEFDTYDVP